MMSEETMVKVSEQQVRLKDMPSVIADLRAKLAAMTAERDTLRVSVASLSDQVMKEQARAQRLNDEKLTQADRAAKAERALAAMIAGRDRFHEHVSKLQINIDTAGQRPAVVSKDIDHESIWHTSNIVPKNASEGDLIVTIHEIADAFSLDLYERIDNSWRSRTCGEWREISKCLLWAWEFDFIRLLMGTRLEPVLNRDWFEKNIENDDTSYDVGAGLP
jgi:hypothetical protein